MLRTRLALFLLIAISLMATGCTTQSAKVFSPVDLNPSMQTGHNVQKAEHLLVILDVSGSMSDMYQEEKKFIIARETIRNMIKGIPSQDMDMEGGLRVFGWTMVPLSRSTESVVKLDDLDKKAFYKALNKITWATGKTCLSKAVAVASDDLDSTTGQIALVIVSDGKETDGEAARAIEVIKNTYRDRLCIYTIQVGADPQGKELLERIARKGQCGFFETAEQLATPQAMADFVATAFLKKGPDGDQDTVPDRIDKCPKTPAGASVDGNGCWQLAGLAFETNKANIASSYYPAIDKAIAILKKYPDMKVRIDGHADKTGPDAFNQKLSLERANAVMAYMVKKGVGENRLSAKGQGATIPVNGNNSKEERTKNRRVTLCPLFE